MGWGFHILSWYQLSSENSDSYPFAFFSCPGSLTVFFLAVDALHHVLVFQPFIFIMKVESYCIDCTKFCFSPEFALHPYANNPSRVTLAERNEWMMKTIVLGQE
uniref:Uncharacterized protein n=1 Tax=Micrurus surinamensis TaxID=129470 RepID=A0A2D4PSC1_MICSU